MRRVHTNVMGHGHRLAKTDNSTPFNNPNTSNGVGPDTCCTTSCYTCPVTSVRKSTYRVPTRLSPKLALWRIVGVGGMGSLFSLL